MSHDETQRKRPLAVSLVNTQFPSADEWGTSEVQKRAREKLICGHWPETVRGGHGRPVQGGLARHVALQPVSSVKLAAGG